MRHLTDGILQLTAPLIGYGLIIQFYFNQPLAELLVTKEIG